MNKILSLVALWICVCATHAQINPNGDWNMPDNPGLVIKKITVSPNDEEFGSAEVKTTTSYGEGRYPVGSTLTLSAIANTGHKFINWTIAGEVSSSSQEYSYVMPDEDVVVTANFEKCKYNVTFVADGAQMKSELLDYGSAIVAPEDPTKEGYTFRGWDKTVAATVPAEDVTYTAVFTVNSYDVVFTIDGEEYSKTSQEYGSAVAVPETPVKTGYTFSGWTTDDAVPSHDVTYDATWTVNKYLVTFDSDNGTDNVTYELDYGSAITVPASPVMEGYTFAGWSPDPTDATMPASDVTYKAVWTVNSYKVTYVVDGVQTDYMVEYGATVNMPDAPEKEGYTFAGWTPEVPSVMPAQDLSFDAQFNINSYKVVFIADGVTVYEQLQEFGSTIVAPADPAKEGYNFDGWSPSVDTTVPSHDVTYTALFGTGEYKVTFMVDGSVYQSLSMDYGDVITTPAADPVKTGYTFGGWDGYVDGATVPAEDVTFDALWNVNQYNVVFDVDGVQTTSTQDYGTAIVVPADPEKEGYTFVGWSPAVAATVPANDVTYVAQWTINKYKVTFVVDDKVYSTTTQDYGAEVTLPESDPSKEGYTFAGWSGYETGATVLAEDVTYTAAWSVNQYKVTFYVDDDNKDERMLDYGAEITLPSDPSKEGYTFIGWSPVVAATVPANDVTYTAIWSVNQYTVTFVIDDDNKIDVTLDYGAEITLPSDPVKEGYTFTGWSGYETGATVPANDVTYTATWEENVPDAVDAMENVTKDCVIYTLQGVRVTEMKKNEVYIINGVKRIIR